MLIALFVDLLHYRTVQRAVRVNRFNWKLMALLTTAIAFGLQWIFYNQPAAGSALPIWQVVLFASIVPVGLAIMAWHHETLRRDITVNWQFKVEDANKRSEQLEIELIAAQKRVERALADAQAASAEKETYEQEAGEMRSELEVARASTAETLLRVDLLQEALDEALPILQAWNAMNQRMQVAAQVHVGQINVQEGAEIIEMSVDTVRRDVARLNGAK